MANNESGTGKGVTESIADEAKGLALEMYKDAAKPAVSTVGATLGAVAKLLMWPIDLITRTSNAALGKLGARVESKLLGVDAQHLLAPPPMIAAQASFGYVLLGDSDADGSGDAAEPLRDMFASLLAASMDQTRASDVHPAFAGIISQMSHDEARLLKSIVDPNETYAIIEGRRPMDDPEHELGRQADGDYVDYHDTDGRGMYLHLGWFSTLGMDIGIDEGRQERHLSNLVRLGILEVRFDRVTEPGNDGVEAKAAADYEAPRRRMDAEFRDCGFDCVGHRGTVAITPFGRQFLISCVLLPHAS